MKTKEYINHIKNNTKIKSDFNIKNKEEKENLLNHLQSFFKAVLEEDGWEIEQVVNYSRTEKEIWIRKEEIEEYLPDYMPGKIYKVTHRCGVYKIKIKPNYWEIYTTIYPVRLLVRLYKSKYFKNFIKTVENKIKECPYQFKR